MLREIELKANKVESLSQLSCLRDMREKIQNGWKIDLVADMSEVINKTLIDEDYLVTDVIVDDNHVKSILDKDKVRRVNKSIYSKDRAVGELYDSIDIIEVENRYMAAVAISKVGSIFFKSQFFYTWWCVMLMSMRGRTNIHWPMHDKWDKQRLKEIGNRYKPLSDINVAWTLYVGCEQSTGITPPDDEDAIEDYIARWSTNVKHIAYRKRPVNTKIMGDVIQHFFQRKDLTPEDIAVADFCTNMEGNMTTGSLKLANTMQVQKERRTQFEEEVGRINSKAGLSLIMTRRELHDEILNNKVRHDVKVTCASDYGKARYVASCDVISYSRMKIIYDRLEYRYKDISVTGAPLMPHTKTQGMLSAYQNQGQSLMDVYLGRGYLKSPMDYEKFDFNPTDEEVYCAIEQLGKVSGCHRLTNLLVGGMKKGKVVGPRTKNIYKGGILSGWYLTSVLDSILNAYWYVMAVILTKVDDDGNIFSCLGDDVNLLIKDKGNGWATSDTIINGLKDMALTISVEKTDKRMVMSEYLRASTVLPRQYAARAVRSVVEGNQKNVQSMIQEGLDSKGKLINIFLKWNRLMVRGLPGVTYFMWREYFYVTGRQNNTQEASAAYALAQVRQGGLGVQGSTPDIKLKTSDYIFTAVIDRKEIGGKWIYTGRIASHEKILSAISNGTVSLNREYKGNQKVQTKCVVIRMGDRKGGMIMDSKSLGVLSSLAREGVVEVGQTRLLLALRYAGIFRSRGADTKWVKEKLRSMGFTKKEISAANTGSFTNELGWYNSGGVRIGIGDRWSSILGKIYGVLSRRPWDTGSTYVYCSKLFTDRSALAI